MNFVQTASDPHSLARTGVFTTDHGEAKNGDRYSFTAGSYTYDAGGDYYISEDAGVWLIFAYAMFACLSSFLNYGTEMYYDRNIKMHIL